MKRIGSNAIIAVIVVVVIFGGVGIAKIGGWWITDTVRQPVSYVSGELEGLPNPADIRGSFTLGDVSRFFEIPLDSLIRALNLVNADENFRLSSFEGLTGELEDGGEIGTDTVRLFTARYAGLDYVPEESTRLPQSALEILSTRLTPADIDALRSVTVEFGAIDASVEPEEDHDEEEESVALIRGGTSFYDLISWGVPREEIEALLGMEMGPLNLTIRDFALGNGLEYNVIKTDLQELVDRYQ